MRAENLERYKIPQSSCFKNITAQELLQDPDYQNNKEVFDLLLAKVALDESDLESTNNFIICECFFNSRYIKYYPEMFINIFQSFLIADVQLRKEFELLLNISN